MKRFSSIFNKDKKEEKQDFTSIDNDYFFRGDFDKKKFSNLNELEVESLVAYIMRNGFHNRYWCKSR